MTARMGFAGLGDIGLPIATRLHEVEGPIRIWNRSPAKADALARSGAIPAASPAELAASCDLIALCVTSDDAVEDVVFGQDGLLSRRDPDRRITLVNLSTGLPEKTRQFAERARDAGAGWLDSPVSGGVPAARAGTLTLFLGGDEETVAAAEPLLAAISRHRTIMGPAGAGQSTKLCNQMIVATNLLAVAQAMAAGAKAGIEAARLPEALAGGFADSLPLQIFGPRMADHIYEPRLGSIGMMLKDVEAARTMMMRAGANATFMDFIAGLYRSAETVEDLLERDISAVVELFEDG